MQQPLKKQQIQETVQTIFGPILLESADLYTFPTGIFGFETVHRFLLSDVAQKKFKGVYLLQPLPPLDHSFLVMPFQDPQRFYEEDDLVKLCDQQQLKRQDTTFYGILAPQVTEETIIFSLSLQAPILMDSTQKVGFQGIFETSRYNKRVDLLRFKR